MALQGSRSEEMRAMVSALLAPRLQAYARPFTPAALQPSALHSAPAAAPEPVPAGAPAAAPPVPQLAPAPASAPAPVPAPVLAAPAPPAVPSPVPDHIRELREDLAAAFRGPEEALPVRAAPLPPAAAPPLPAAAPPPLPVVGGLPPLHMAGDPAVEPPAHPQPQQPQQPPQPRLAAAAAEGALLEGLCRVLGAAPAALCDVWERHWRLAAAAAGHWATRPHGAGYLRAALTAMDAAKSGLPPLELRCSGELVFPCSAAIVGEWVAQGGAPAHPPAFPSLEAFLLEDDAFAVLQDGGGLWSDVLVYPARFCAVRSLTHTAAPPPPAVEPIPPLLLPPPPVPPQWLPPAAPPHHRVLSWLP